MKFSMNTRDLINVAIFAVLYFVTIYAAGIIGFLGPVAMIIGWIIGILIGGIILILSVARVPKLGTLTITGVVVGLGMMAGHSIWVLPGTALLGFLADLIITRGGTVQRVRTTRSILALGVFHLWMIIPLLPIFFHADDYFAYIATGMGDDYASSMRNIFSPAFVAGWGVCLFVLGCLSGWIGVRVGRRHFQRAGLTR